MKEILVLCGCFPNEFEEEYLDNSVGLAQIAADRLQKNIIQGICEIPDVTPYVLTAPFVGYFPSGYKKPFVKSHRFKSEDGVPYTIVGFLNIKGIETWLKSEKLSRAIIQWCRESPTHRNVVIYSHYAGFMRAIGKAKRKYPDLKACCVITDMPELSMPKPTSFLGKLKSMPSRLMFHITYKNLPYVDDFALLSKHMAPELSLTEERYCVVECMCDTSASIPSQNAFLGKRTTDGVYFAYSGTLDKQYGIKELLEAFNSVDDAKLHLWICGDGNGKEDVLEWMKKDSRIEYFGCLKHNDVVALQQASDILINPRSSKGIFTKYSFPSKTIEYMLAGKPVIAYKLMGIPDEYDDYLFYIEDSGAGLADAILKYGNMPKEKLVAAGTANREFAVENKNYFVQTKKILAVMGL